MNQLFFRLGWLGHLLDIVLMQFFCHCILVVKPLMYDLCNHIKAPAKQLAKSSALASLTSLGKSAAFTCSLRLQREGGVMYSIIHLYRQPLYEHGPRFQNIFLHIILLKKIVIATGSQGSSSLLTHSLNRPRKTHSKKKVVLGTNTRSTPLMLTTTIVCSHMQGSSSIN